MSIAGGYEPPAEWLRGREQVTGSVLRAGFDRRGSAVVRLDEPLTVTVGRDREARSAVGRFLILAPRFKQRWWSPRASRVVHLELHASEPSPDSLGTGEWFESHASYRIISPAGDDRFRG